MTLILLDYKKISVSTTPTISESEAIDIAKGLFGIGDADVASVE